jgi:uncharacterized protein (TIGR03435 family)
MSKFNRLFALIGAMSFSLLVLGAVMAPNLSFAQPTPLKSVFDVATVKPAAPLDLHQMALDVQAGRMPKVGPQINASRAAFTYMSLSELIAMAWNVRLYQISGPEWLAKQRFDIEATIPEGTTKADVPVMLRALLEERFKLIAHQAQEEHKVLALVVGKGGPKMKESSTLPQPINLNAPLSPGEQQVDGLDGPMRIKVHSDGSAEINMGTKGTLTRRFDRQSKSMHMGSSAVTMAGFAEMLSDQFLQMGGADSRQVVDMTGLKSCYEVDIEISLADLMAMARATGIAMPAGPTTGDANALPVASDPGSGMSVFESVRLMGLKLEERNAIVDRLAIDHVEKTPTEN